MGCIFFAKEPMVIVQGMDSYFNQTQPECSVYSEDHNEFPIHKEILYQTKYMREMINNVGVESKIEIMCTALTSDELEEIINFLYTGNISNPDKSVVSELSKNLTELFGFPLIEPMLISKEDAEQICSIKRPRKQWLIPKYLQKRIKIEENCDFEDETIKSEGHEYENNEEYHIENQTIEPKTEDNNSELKEVSSNRLKTKKLKNPAKIKTKAAGKFYTCKFGCGKKMRKPNLLYHELKACKMNPDVPEEKIEKIEKAKGSSKAPHICSVCGKTLSSKKQLEAHISNNCGDRRDSGIKKCPVCKEDFKLKALLINHITTKHENYKLHDCSQCDRQYTSARGLQQHLYSFHERKKSGSYDCFFCGDLFLQESKLKHHIKIKHKDRNYECLECKASYKSQWSLHMHIEHVHEGKRYQCSDCGEVYDSLTKLDTHIGLAHDKTKLFECPTCKATYASAKTLNKHVAFVHNQNSGHLCNLCGKQFQWKASLKEHVSSIHEGITHECPICQKSFPYKNTMQAHVRELHEGKIKSVKCSMCDKEFKSNNHVKRHVMEVHEKKRPHACSLCELRFGQKSQLKTHIKGKHKNFLL